MGQANRLKARQEQLALGGVDIGQTPIVFGPGLKPRHRRCLKGRRRPHGEKVMHLPCGLHRLLRANQIAQAPAGDGVGLGQRAHRQAVVPHAGKGGQAHMDVGGIDDMLIHLIGDDPGVMGFGQGADFHQLLPGKHLAAGVLWVAYHQGLDAAGKRRLQRLPIHRVIRRKKRHKHRLGPRDDGIRPVVLIKGGEHRHLVPGVDHCQHRTHHGLRRPAGDHHLGFRVNLPANRSPLLVRQRAAEGGSAVSDLVLMGARKGSYGQSLHQGPGRIKIRKTLGEVDRPHAISNARHAPDDRLCKPPGALADLWHGPSFLVA